MSAYFSFPSLAPWRWDVTVQNEFVKGASGIINLNTGSFNICYGNDFSLRLQHAASGSDSHLDQAGVRVEAEAVVHEFVADCLGILDLRNNLFVTDQLRVFGKQLLTKGGETI